MVQLVQAGVQDSGVVALVAQADFDRFPFGFCFGRGQLGEKAVDLCRESRSSSSSPTVGAVMSVVASCRVRTSSIAEKAASASPSLTLGISRSKWAPAL